MPELPEVEAARWFAQEHLAGRTIRRATAADDRIVFTGAAPRTIAGKLTGRRVVGTGRKGKYFWLELDRRPWPVMHFGMGGDLYAYRTPAERPRFWKLELETDDGARIAMTNGRRLGRIRLVEDPHTEPPIGDLGFDPLLELPGPAAFERLFAARKAPIKALLLDQKQFAGVGNWIADEVLYQAGVDPRRRASTLSAAEARKIRSVLSRVIRKAVDVNADSSRFPRAWLFHRRWGRDAEARTHRGEPLAFDTVGGRTTAWVPGVQR